MIPSPTVDVNGSVAAKANEKEVETTSVRKPGYPLTRLRAAKFVAQKARQDMEDWLVVPWLVVIGRESDEGIMNPRSVNGHNLASIENEPSYANSIRDT